jgi:hypothetical protein
MALTMANFADSSARGPKRPESRDYAIAARFEPSLAGALQVANDKVHFTTLEAVLRFKGNDSERIAGPVAMRT